MNSLVHKLFIKKIIIKKFKHQFVYILIFSKLNTLNLHKNSKLLLKQIENFFEYRKIYFIYLKLNFS